MFLFIFVRILSVSILAQKLSSAPLTTAKETHLTHRLLHIFSSIQLSVIQILFCYHLTGHLLLFKVSILIRLSTSKMLNAPDEGKYIEAVRE